MFCFFFFLALCLSQCLELFLFCCKSGFLFGKFRCLSRNTLNLSSKFIFSILFAFPLFFISLTLLYDLFHHSLFFLFLSFTFLISPLRFFDSLFHLFFLLGTLFVLNYFEHLFKFCCLFCCSFLGLRSIFCCFHFSSSFGSCLLFFIKSQCLLIELLISLDHQSLKGEEVFNSKYLVHNLLVDRITRILSSFTCVNKLFVRYTQLCH